MKCQLCSCLGGKTEEFQKKSLQEMKVHARTHLNQVGHFGNSGGYKKIFRSCFPDVFAIINFGEGIEVISRKSHEDKRQPLFTFPPQQPKRKIRTMTSDPVHSHCNQLRRQYDQHGKLKCRLCFSRVGYNKWSCRPYISHVVSIHLRRKLFSCRYCQSKFYTEMAVRDHIFYDHKESSAGGVVKNFDKYEKQIIDLLTKCFGTKEIQKRSRKGSRRLFPHKRQNPIQIYCGILRGEYGPNHEFQCRLCKAQVGGKFNKNESLIRHVMKHHLGTDLFTCQGCGMKFPSRIDAIRHIGRVHKENSTDHRYDDNSHKFELRIKDLLSQCFGKMDEKGESQKVVEPKSEEKSEEPMKKESNHHPDTIVKKRPFSQRMYGCHICQFSTKLEKLFKGHCTVVHKKV